MPVKLSQFPLPLTPQPALDAVDAKNVKRAFQTFVRKGIEFLGTGRAWFSVAFYFLDTVLAVAVSAARDLLWFAQYKQADGAVGLP